jgi:hypothetical protein
VGLASSWLSMKEVRTEFVLAAQHSSSSLGVSGSSFSLSLRPELGFTQRVLSRWRVVEPCSVKARGPVLLCRWGQVNALFTSSGPGTCLLHLPSRTSEPGRNNNCTQAACGGDMGSTGDLGCNHH